MRVIELIRMYGIENFEKTYYNQYGSFCDLIPLDKLHQMEVKSFSINFPTNQATITVIQHQVRVFNNETYEVEYYKAKKVLHGKKDTLLVLEDGDIIAFDNDLYQTIVVK